MFRIPKSTVSAKGAVSLRECARQLGIDPGQLSREAGKVGFPSIGSGNNRKFVVEEVRQYRAANVVSRRPNEAPTPSTPTPEDDPSIVALRAAGSSPVDMAVAGARLAARRLADAATSGLMGAATINELRNALENLRRAEAASLSLDLKKRKLIRIEEANAVMGAAVSRLISLFGRLEATLSTEFTQWLEDPKVKDMATDDRARHIRQFIHKAGNDLRELESKDVEAMLDQLEKDE